MNLRIIADTLLRIFKSFVRTSMHQDDIIYGNEPGKAVVCVCVNGMYVLQRKCKCKCVFYKRNKPKEISEKLFDVETH